MAITMLGDWSDLGSVEAIARAVRVGDLDPVKLAERALRRAAEVADLNAVVHLDPDYAMRAAEAVGRTRAVTLTVVSASFAVRSSRTTAPTPPLIRPAAV